MGRKTGMNIVPYDEMIDCESWYHLADYHYTGQDDLPSGVIHCDMGAIPEFFSKITNNGNKYVVISSRSDFGLHYQSVYPPFLDYSKVATMFIKSENSGGGYKDLTLPAPINKDRCTQTDRYSIKCYLYTEATFDEIPENVVRWFVCNNTILDNPRITSIPFGFNGVDGSTDGRDKITNKIANMNWNGDRAKDLYVNFAFYTNERAKLFALYKPMPFVTAEQNKTFDEYLDQLKIHNLVLCPPGNGWDCYRTLEALYMGCIPVMEYNAASVMYALLNLPVILLESLESFTELLIKRVRQVPLNDRRNWNLSTVTLSYWKIKIHEARQNLVS